MADEQQQSVPMTPEEVLAQLKTRGFEDGFQRTVLRHFKGKLTSIGGNMVTRFKPPRMEVVYNFEEIDVIKSTEPYLFPVAQITIMYSNRKQSGMGVLGMSIDKIINVGEDGEPLPSTVPGGIDEDGHPCEMANPDLKMQDYLIGKVQEWQMTPGHMLWDGNAKDAEHPKGQEMPKECWELISVEGEETQALPKSKATTKATTKAAPKTATKPSAKGAMARALELLEGKTEQEFYQAVFSDPVAKSDGALVTRIIAREFIAPLMEARQVMMSEDKVYHVVG